MGFLNKKVDLGGIRVGSQHTVVFRFDDEIKKLNKIETSCGCTLVDYIAGSKEIKIMYKAQEMPIHLIKENKKFYQTTKAITVFFEELAAPGTESTEVLTFSANVFRK